jgi:hypothetical protein
MKQKPMLTICFEKEDFDVAFLPKSKEAEHAIEAKAAAKNCSVGEYLREMGGMSLILSELV